MPKTKRENFIFAFIMCSFMCTIMSAYNMFLRNGLSYETTLIWLKSLIPTFIVAFIVSYILVNPNAKKLSQLLTQNKPKNRGLFITLFMVIGMVSIMSMYGTIMSDGITDNFIIEYLTNVICSFIFALPLQLFVVGPLVKNIFNKVTQIQTLREV